MLVEIIVRPLLLECDHSILYFSKQYFFSLSLSQCLSGCLFLGVSLSVCLSPSLSLCVSLSVSLSLYMCICAFLLVSLSLSLYKYIFALPINSARPFLLPQRASTLSVTISCRQLIVVAIKKK